MVYVLLGDALSLCVIVFACFWLFYWVYKNYKSKSIYSVIYWYFQTVKKTWWCCFKQQAWDDDDFSTCRAM